MVNMVGISLSGLRSQWWDSKAPIAVLDFSFSSAVFESCCGLFRPLILFFPLDHSEVAAPLTPAPLPASAPVRRGAVMRRDIY
jgi:hypothetical protein